MEHKKKLDNAQKRIRILRVRKPEKVYNETKIINGVQFKIFKWSEFGVEMTTRKLKNVKSSVPKSKKDPAESFPKCTRENPTKSRNMVGMPTNVKLSMKMYKYQQLLQKPPNGQRCLQSTKEPMLVQRLCLKK